MFYFMEVRYNNLSDWRNGNDDDDNINTVLMILWSGYDIQWSWSWSRWWALSTADDDVDDHINTTV